MPYRNWRQGMVSGLRPPSAKSCISLHPDPTVRIGNTLLPVEESSKFPGLWRDSHLSFKKQYLSFKKHISVLKRKCKEALNFIRAVAHLKCVCVCWKPSECVCVGLLVTAMLIMLWLSASHSVTWTILDNIYIYRVTAINKLWLRDVRVPRNCCCNVSPRVIYS